MQSASLYIHFPLCKSKCPYCDFNSHIINFNNLEDWKNAYHNELKFFYNLTGHRKITSIFFGGGTPSLMPISLVSDILDNIAKYYSLTKNIEISLEANPTSSEAAKFQSLQEIGVNRLSLGIQAFNDHDLKFLGREHSKREALSAILTAKKYFKNFSFDLIYARPKQQLDEWNAELEEALSLKPPHISLYQLTIEKGTKFYQDYKLGKFSLPSENQQIKLYNLTTEKCLEHNLFNYEISNYAKPDYHSKHNLNYWQYGDYIAIGAGAHSRITKNKVKEAIFTYHQPEKWLKHNLNYNHAIQQQKTLTKVEMLEELLIFGLRIKEGIKLDLFNYYFTKNINDIFADKLDQLSAGNLISITNNNIKATANGRNLIHNITNFLVKNANL